MRRSLLTVVSFLLFAAVPAVLQSRGFRLEAVQGAAFPIVAVLVLVAGGYFFRIPKWVPVLALLGWLGCVLNREISISVPESFPMLTIARVNNDPLGIQSRSLQRYGATIAKTYDIQSPELLSRAFRSSSDAYEWLRRRNDARLVVVGATPALELVFGAAPSPFPCRSSGVTICSDLEKLGNEFNILLDREALVVAPPFASTPLLMTMRPESIQFASDPVELTVHVLTWLTEGLRLASVGGAEEIARAEDALFQSSSALGRWKTAAPVAVSSAILGTLQLSESAEPSTQVYNDAVKLLYRALRLIREDNDPELWAMIVNNLAVAKLYRDNTPQTILESRKLLRQASGVMNRKKVPVLAARIATTNLALMDEILAANRKPLSGEKGYASATDT